MAGPTSITVGGLNAFILVDGARKGIGRETGPWREVVYQTTWADSDAFCDALMGLNAPVAVGGQVAYPFPHQYPGNPILFCEEAEAEGVGTPQPDTKLIAFTLAHIRAVYRVPRFDVAGTDTANAFGQQPIPWGRDEIRGFSVNYQVAIEAVEGADDPADVPARKPDWLVPHIEYRRTRLMVPYLFLDTMSSLVMCVNAEPMWNRDTGTIRFEDWDTLREFNTDGSVMQEVVMRFQWRPFDWNAELTAEGLSWKRFKSADSTAYRYPYADLSPLFQ